MADSSWICLIVLSTVGTDVVLFFRKQRILVSVWNCDRQRAGKDIKTIIHHDTRGIFYLLHRSPVSLAQVILKINCAAIQLHTSRRRHAYGEVCRAPEKVSRLRKRGQPRFGLPSC